MHRSAQAPLAVALAATVVLGGCGKAGSDATGESSTLATLKEKAGNYWQAVKSYSVEQKKKLLAASKDEIKSMRKRYEQLTERAKKLGKAGEARWKRIRKRIEKRLQQAEKRTKALKKTSSDEWRHAKRSLADGLKKLSAELDQAAAAIEPSATAPATREASGS